jgi:hypothetical protein
MRPKAVGPGVEVNRRILIERKRECPTEKHATKHLGDDARLL